MTNNNGQPSTNRYLLFLTIACTLLLSGCSLFNQKKEPSEPQYQLDANLIIDQRPLESQSVITSADQRATLYFEDDKMSRLYKVFYILKPGDQEGTVEIFTSVHTEVTAPSFLTYEGQEASATFPPKLPVIEVQVKATPVMPVHP